MNHQNAIAPTQVNKIVFFTLIRFSSILIEIWLKFNHLTLRATKCTKKTAIYIYIDDNNNPTVAIFYIFHCLTLIGGKFQSMIKNMLFWHWYENFLELYKTIIQISHCWKKSIWLKLRLYDFFVALLYIRYIIYRWSSFRRSIFVKIIFQKQYDFRQNDGHDNRTSTINIYFLSLF